MKIQIRKGVFETNSSSVHTLTMCMDDDYQKWKNGEYVFARWNEKLIPISEANKDEDEERYMTYNDYSDYYDYETYHETFETPNGDIVHAFGYYGHDY